MLHTEILTEEALGILKKLMADKALSRFNLVGGTALSLYLGHRKSIDLDLFTNDSFNVPELRKHLVDMYDFKESFSERDTLKGYINGVFIDCISYKYPSISPVNKLGDIRITGVPDLLAMKIAVITDSGEREKDFVDIAFFSTKVSLKGMLGFYESKYKGVSVISASKALTYFDDVKRTEPLMLVNGDYDWKLIEKRLNDMVKNPDKIFTNLPQKHVQQEECAQTHKRSFRR